MKTVNHRVAFKHGLNGPMTIQVNSGCMYVYLGRSSWWHIAFMLTLNLIVVETCNLKRYITYFIVITLFLIIAYIGYIYEQYFRLFYISVGG